MEKQWVTARSLGRFSAEAAASLPGAARTAVMGHLLEFRVLIRGEDRLQIIVSGCHQRFHLLSLLLRQEIVIVMDGLELVAKVLLTGLDLGHLVIGQAELEPEP